jgi:hypothetical protein
MTRVSYRYPSRSANCEFIDDVVLGKRSSRAMDCWCGGGLLCTCCDFDLKMYTQTWFWDPVTFEFYNLLGFIFYLQFVFIKWDILLKPHTSFSFLFGFIRMHNC